MKGVFLTMVTILILFNAIYVIASPEASNIMYLGALTGLISTVLAVGVISGIQFLGSGLNSESIRIIFSVGAILNMLFRISIAGFPVGIGLVNNIMSIFSPTDFAGLGYFAVSIISIITLISGIITVVGG